MSRSMEETRQGVSPDELFVKKAIDALSDSKNYETFEFSLDTDGDESSVEIIKAAK